MYHILRLKYIALAVLIIFLFDLFGVFTHLFEKDLHESFDYPLNDPDVLRYSKQMRNGKPTDVPPINGYNYTYRSDCRHKCRQADDDDTLIIPRVVFVIKSAMHHFDRRNAIRQSWGFEKRFSDVIIRTVFTLGIAIGHEQSKIDLQAAIDKERQQHNDIVQGEFIDSYFNNTVKTMMGMRWAIEFCPRSKFFMFVDDDYYVSTKNVLRFIRNPVNYPEYIDEADETLRQLARRLSQSDSLNSNQTAIEDDGVDVNEVRNLVDSAKHSIEVKDHVKTINDYLSKRGAKKAAADAANKIEDKTRRHLLDSELPHDAKLFAGFVLETKPHRHKTSKWYVPLDEYPWSRWPAYVTAGAIVFSREALIEMYYMSMYTKHFR